MSPYPAAALESAAGTTVDINARNKTSVANGCCAGPNHQPLKTICRATACLRYLCVTSGQTGSGGTGRSESVRSVSSQH